MRVKKKSNLCLLPPSVRLLKPHTPRGLVKYTDCSLVSRHQPSGIDGAAGIRVHSSKSVRQYRTQTGLLRYHNYLYPDKTPPLSRCCHRIPPSGEERARDPESGLYSGAATSLQPRGMRRSAAARLRRTPRAARRAS